MATRAFLFAALLTLLARSALADADRETYRNALSLDIMGRAYVCGFEYERALTARIGVGVGFAFPDLQNAGGADAKQNAILIPAFGTFYFSEAKDSFFVTAGASYVTNSDSLNGLKSPIKGIDFSTDQLFPVFGLGYSTWLEANRFLFRIGLYETIASDAVTNIGFSFGYAF